ncbi:transmembrane cytochrome oxidase associated protein [Pseudoalteromonas sp. MMG022]|uniref:transmembrane cytochrome oxidase associated protein n=1 Tax=Pseudoalteromonas sp. MMG022 TaxID=2909978 RepID=UPI001F2AD4B1|nr:transmembrane cytochrome oxidase associated protein [Pseudoalteromonas sp. MMG022]MCF6435497.1 transmembrane cytochrome oxidase associated protein [Pseudoalteromonas sp. MMG022]
MISKPLGVFIGCCVVPLALAYAAVKLEWLPEHTTNHGQFLQSELRVPSWHVQNNELWTIAINAPDACLEACEKQLNALQNLYTALGKHQKHVGLAVLNRSQDVAAIDQYQSYQLAETLPAAHLYLIDHRGLMVLQYQYFQDDEKNRLEHKGLLKDLKKLLKYARSS